jgi:hypothetical protein
MMTLPGCRTTGSLLVAASALILPACSSNRAAVETGNVPGVASSAKSSSTTITNANGRSTDELFHGKFPGVEVFQAPGGGIRVKIRNSGAYDAESGDPIYVVDGLEVSTIDGVLHLDPNNIAKIEVERVSALYGIRGANGVVKITTKR